MSNSRQKEKKKRAAGWKKFIKTEVHFPGLASSDPANKLTNFTRPLNRKASRNSVLAASAMMDSLVLLTEGHRRPKPVDFYSGSRLQRRNRGLRQQPNRRGSAVTR
jgi:hypothetical protein